TAPPPSNGWTYRGAVPSASTEPAGSFVCRRRFDTPPSPPILFRSEPNAWTGFSGWDERSKMRRSLFKSKIHRATVTDANLEYEGSVTLDEQLMKAADILP